MLCRDMTWEELTQLLTELAHEHGTEVKVIREAGLEAVFLHLVPVAWFSSMKFTNALNMGVYQGEDKPAGWHQADSLGRSDFGVCPRKGERRRRRTVQPVAQSGGCSRVFRAVSLAHVPGRAECR